MKFELTILVSLILLVASVAHADRQDSQGVLIKYGCLKTDSVSHFHADPGKQFVVVNLTIENNGNTLFEFEPYNLKLETENAIYDYYLLDKAYFSSPDIPTIDSATIKIGGKIIGSTFYQIPIGAKQLDLMYVDSSQSAICENESHSL